MIQEKKEEGLDQAAEPAEKQVSETVSRDLFRQVIKQRQELKQELRQLKNKNEQLPEDWEERLPRWRELETRSQALAEGELIRVEEVRAERADWEIRERKLNDRLDRLILDGRIKSAAVKAGAVDPDDVVALTRGLFRASASGDREISLDIDALEKSGLIVEGAEEAEPTLDEVVVAFLEQKPHLIRPGIRSGSGSRPRLLTAGTPAGPDPMEQARLILAQRRRNQSWSI